jgi:hypothetical protein
MLRLVSLAVTAILLFGQALSGPAVAQSNVLPSIGADGLTLPLAVDQLDASERTTYANIPSNSDDARRFLYTRGYLRYCRLVVAEKLPPLQLPPLPARVNWNRGFLSQDEAKNVLDVALAMKLTARMNQRPPQ